MVAKHGAAKRATDGTGARAGDGHGLRSVDGGEAAALGVEAEGALALDRLIHERMRLGIVSALAVNDTLTFNDLKQLLHPTDGHLNEHSRQPVEAGQRQRTKAFQGRKPD